MNRGQIDGHKQNMNQIVREKIQWSIEPCILCHLIKDIIYQKLLVSPHASKIKIDYLKEVKLDSFLCIAWHVNTEGFQNISKMNFDAYANGEVRAKCFLLFHERWNKLIVARFCWIPYHLFCETHATTSWVADK